MEEQRLSREKGAKPKRGSFADERALHLAKERKRFNVNQWGFYQGGCNAFYVHTNDSAK